MKKLLLLLGILINLQAYAQSGALGQVAAGLIGSKPKAETKGHLLINANLTYPISTGDIITGSKIKLPPTYISVEYGIYQNLTLGIMGGLMKTETSGTINQLANDLASGNFDIDNFLNSLLGGLLGGGTGTNNSNPYKITNSSILVGGTLKYNFVGTENLNLFIANRTGVKIRTVKKDYIGNTGVEFVDALVNSAESTSGIFSSFSFGGNYYLNQKKSIAISPELGWGPGWGDGISISNNPILLTIGATYHLRPNGKTKK